MKAVKAPKSHIYRAVRDPVTNNVLATSPTMFTAVTNSAGTWTNQFMLAPLGVTGMVFPGAAAGTNIVPQVGQVFSPLLPWLYNTAKNFERYRVTRCILVFVGSVGSTATGQILLDSTTDAEDLTTPATFATSTGGKIYDLASTATRELKFSCDIDSSWKKCSGQMFSLFNGSTVCVNNSANDQLFTCPIIAIQGGPASTSCGSFYVEIDVEFRDPVSYTANV